LPYVVPVLFYLAINWEWVLPVGGGIGQHDHVALCKISRGFVTRGSKDAINAMAKQTFNIQLPMKQFNAE
jgi:hypothetical protein